MIICPHCNRRTHEGKHCEKCGGELPMACHSNIEQNSALDSHIELLSNRIDSEMQKIEENANRATRIANIEGGIKFSGNGQVALDIDRLGILYENIAGSVRFRLTPPRGMELRNIKLKCTTNLLADVVCGAELPYIKDSAEEFLVGFPKMEAGSYVWSVDLVFESNRIRHTLKSSFVLLVMRSENSKAIAEKLVFNITNDIKAEGAADVHVSNRIADELKGVLNKGEDPFRVLQKVVLGRDRAWCHMKLYDAEARAKLPPCPPEAKTDCLKLDFGYRIIRLCTNRIISLGRNRGCDFFLRPVDNCTEEDKAPYKKMSRWHCYFEHNGKDLIIHDGCRQGVAVAQPSTYGTFVNNRNIGECGSVTVNDGETSVLSLGGISCDNVVSLNVRACSPKVACAKCPYANRQWCGEGRPSLVLTRRDSIAESFVCFWSCFNLGEIDHSFDGLVIFRKDGAFAWFRDSECGWLIPDRKLKTDYGVVTVTTGMEDKHNSENKVGG